MTDDLRTRIAAVLFQRFIRTMADEDVCVEWEDIDDKEPWLEDADAVIRELKQQWRADYGYDGYSNCTSREEAQEHVDDFNEHLGDDWQDGEQAMVLHRYVTEWVSEIRDDQEVRQ